MDKRKYNGGNSTKTNGVDKRKNEYRIALSNAATVEDIEDVIKTVLKDAKGGNIQASKIILEYYIGKPKESIDLTSGDEPIQNFNLSKLSEKELQVILKIHAGQSTDTDEESD